MAEQDANAELGRDYSDRVSAIVVSYYTGPVLARCLAALAASNEVAEIILVDNGNWEGALDEALGPLTGCPVTVVSGHGNVGFATACNIGAKRAQKDYLLFINPDAVMPTGGVAQLLRGLHALERPALIGAKLVGPNGEEQQGSRRTALTPWRAMVELCQLYRLAPNHPYFQRFNLHTEEELTHLHEMPTVTGACFFLHRGDYFAIGGMDERYFLHVEDIDFCLRFRNAGGKVYFDPTVAVAHFKSSSRVNPFGVERRKVSSMILYFRRHFSDAYPRPFFWLLEMALWGQLGVKMAIRYAMNAWRFIRIGPKGRDWRKRARALAARRGAR